MRVKKRGLNIGFVYPCTKREVDDAIGRDTISFLAFQDKLAPWTFRDRSRSPVRGTVLLEALVTPKYFDTNAPSASLYVFELREEEFSVHLHNRLREIMRTVMKPWITSKLEGIRSDGIRSWSLLAELNTDGIVLHEIKSTNRANELRQLPA